MNERMLELFTQAHVPDTAIDPSNNMRYQTTTFSAEKFAELIVQECVGVELYWLSEQNRKAVAEKIKQHFGIEE